MNLKWSGITFLALGFFLCALAGVVIIGAENDPVYAPSKMVARFMHQVMHFRVPHHPDSPPASSPQPQSPSEDYFVLINGKVRMIQPDSGIPTAEAFAVLNGKFVQVGTNQQILRSHPDAKIIDAQGLSVLPGFIDSHAHLLNQARLMIEVDLMGLDSLEKIIEALLDFVEENPVPEGGWLLGRGWDQNLWGGEFPTKEDLDPYFPTTPVYLSRVDGHASWCNSAVLQIVPPLPDEDPAGGLIIRDENGEPTGVFVDNAMGLIYEHVPPYDDETLMDALTLAIQECNRLGLTGVHDAGVPKAEIEFLKKAVDQGIFNLRDYVFIACEGALFCPEVSPITIGYGDKITVRSVKMLLDGALGSWGAAMIEPYSDKPETSGLLLISPEDVEPTVRSWVNAGYQVNVHCIGDLANRLVIDAFEVVIKEIGLDQDVRLRLEHAQIINSSDIPRIAPLNIIPSFQPTHATSDMLYAESRVGPERIKGAYAWQTLAQQGAHLPLGSDFPVERVSPILGIYAAVTRQDASGQPVGGWYPEERLTMDQAIRGFTIEAAYAAFQEKELGSIEVGKWADFIILDRDLYEIRPEDILGTQVLATYLGGKLVYGGNFTVGGHEWTQ